MRTTWNLILKYQSISIIILFIFINILFNFPTVKELITPDSEDRVAAGDSTLAEFILENNYQNILHGENPFIIHQKLFYPFDINLSLNDPGTTNTIFFFILRPFLTIHKSMLIIVLINSFLSNILMYFLLKKLKISTPISFLLALSYGFMPVAAYRLLGHYTYTSIYFFPLLYLVILKFIEQKSFIGKASYSILFGFLMPLLLLHNFYFFLIVIMAMVMYTVYYLFFETYKTIEFYVRNFLYITLSIIPFILILLPWIQAVRYYNLTEDVSPMPGYGGAIELSADLLGFITPSEFNPIYRLIIFSLANIFPVFEQFKNFYLFNWEKFIYPGVFILVTYTFTILRYKNIPASVRKVIQPHFFISLIFGIFLLGPFLKIANQYALVLDDGINVFFPLPFLILHYLPGLGTLRAPTRFSPAFTFLALIVLAYLWQWIYNKLSPKKRYIMIAVTLLIFFIDQFYVLPPRTTFDFPIRSYNYIKKDPEKVTVLEIPFTVRDGFDYIGFVHGISPMNGHFYHGKPIIGGYFARVPMSIFNYYKNLPFIGYITRIIDKGNYEPMKESPKDVVIKPLETDIDEVKNEIDFLSIKYVLLKNNEKYSKPIAEILSNTGFKLVMNDGEFNLYERPVNKIILNAHIFGKRDDFLYSGQGFTNSGENFRLISGNKAKVFLKVPDHSYSTLEFSLEPTKNIDEVTIYINNIYISSQQLKGIKKTYRLSKISAIHPGINTITYIFKNKQNTEMNSGAVKLFNIKLIN
jgi:hypothetical protein